MLTPATPSMDGCITAPGLAFCRTLFRDMLVHRGFGHVHQRNVTSCEVLPLIAATMPPHVASMAILATLGTWVQGLLARCQCGICGQLWMRRRTRSTTLRCRRFSDTTRSNFPAISSIIGGICLLLSGPGPSVVDRLLAEVTSTAVLKDHQRLGCEDDGNLGADEPRRGEVGPLVAGVELPSAVDDFFLPSSTLRLSSCRFVGWWWTLGLAGLSVPGERGLIRFGGGGLELRLVAVLPGCESHSTCLRVTPVGWSLP